MANNHSNEQSIVSCFENASNISVCDDGKKFLFFKGDDKFEAIYKSLKHILNGSHDMPALGVSLDSEIQKAKQSGFWLELIFDSVQTFNEMPFECLLFEVKSDFSGVNLHRKFDGKYQGRCFYIDLNSTMKPLFDILKNLSKTEN